MKIPECIARQICGIFGSLGRNNGVLPVQARAKELRLELLNSKRLQAHFEEHPADLALLKHDKPLAKTAAASHLKHLPAYLRDAAGMKKTSYSGNKGRGDSFSSMPAAQYCMLFFQMAASRTTHSFYAQALENHHTLEIDNPLALESVRIN